MLDGNARQSAAPIGSLVKTSLVDYPGKVAAALFLHGCNLRCPYCYNGELVTGSPSNYNAATLQTVLEHLEKRRNVLSGFVISGGEPCQSPLLEQLIRAAHGLGYAVKLDTNGTRPDRLAYLLSKAELTPDFIAMDVKTSPENYRAVGKSCKEELSESIRLVSQLPPQMREFRTVLVPPLVDKRALAEIAAALPRDAAWRFAQFSAGKCLDESFNAVAPYTKQQAEELVTYAKSLISDSELR